MNKDKAEQPAQQQEPMFWYRPCSNGMYEGPIHNAQIERVRKESGAWHPLYTSPHQRKPLSENQLRDIVFKSKRVAGQSSFVKSYVDMCRMIEQAHGIKEHP